MRFVESDKRNDAPRPLARCGAHVAPGRDARWRGVGAKTQRIDTIAARRRSAA